MRANLTSTIIEKNTDVDYELIIPGDDFEELDWDKLFLLKESNRDIALTIEKIFMSVLWEITNINILKKSIEKHLNFIDLEKVILKFPFKNTYKYSDLDYKQLFGNIYYYNKENKLQTFKFVINTSTGKIKYFN